MKSICIGIAAAVLLTAAPALAQQVTLGKRGGTVFVWKDGDAMSEGMNLIQAGVHKSNPMMVMRLISCMVEPGTKAIISDAGFATHTILVIDGEFSGCRGDVVMEDVAW
ncbi:hypothetical protein [Ensifer adhaerens]